MLLSNGRTRHLQQVIHPELNIAKQTPNPRIRIHVSREKFITEHILKLHKLYISIAITKSQCHFTRLLHTSQQWCNTPPTADYHMESNKQTQNLFITPSFINTHKIEPKKVEPSQRDLPSGNTRCKGRNIVLYP